jgi:hypothetical protein
VKTSGRLNRVQIDVAGTIVEISWDERATLLQKLHTAAYCDTIIEKLVDATGGNGPTELDDEEQSRLRVTLERWGINVLQPAGLEHLLLALVQANPRGRVGAGNGDA